MSSGADPIDRPAEWWWLGRDERREPWRHLRVGPLAFDLAGIDVRRIVVGGLEVISRIYVGVRYVDWDTLPPVVSGVAVRTADDGTVDVTFEARHLGSGIDLVWRGSISASPARRLTCGMDGTVVTESSYNRIGFCVLHPAVRTRRHTSRRTGREASWVHPQRTERTR
jgi:hypothetical protein